MSGGWEVLLILVPLCLLLVGLLMIAHISRIRLPHSSQHPTPPALSTTKRTSIPICFLIHTRSQIETCSCYIYLTVRSFFQTLVVHPVQPVQTGHTIVPGVVPPRTLLYHVRPNHEMLRNPDWVFTGPEHADSFCCSHDEEGCWQLTLTTMRPLNVLYFDGSTAAKLRNGTLDSQDIFGWREVKPEYFFEEWRSIRDLCGWGA